MSHRKPPALANWLLDCLGPARRNPPLAGDLIEEFQNGRSAAWFWRQTLVAIFSGLGRNAGRRLTGSLIGWAAEVGVAFPLWRFHILPQPPPIIPTVAWIAVAVFFIWLFVFARKAPKTASPLVPTKSVAAYAWDQFILLLPIYCGFSLVLGMDDSFWVIQTVWLYSAFAEVLGPGRRYFQR